MTKLIELSSLSVGRAGRPVLSNVSLELAAGERLALVGPNGAGKTTLLRTILGLEPSGGGSIRLFGEECRTEKQFARLRPRIGFLFQDSDDQLFCPTVIEDVAFGPLNLGHRPAAARAMAEAALASLGIADLAGRISHRLSGGEKRLVCLAGLLAMEPDMLMLDEPTNGVDAENGGRLREALRSFPGAMILVSHDAEFVADLATRAMIIRDGRLLPAEIHDHAHTHRHRHIHASRGD
jgi:cobalt/nickel transport system ATP-binding protein